MTEIERLREKLAELITIANAIPPACGEAQELVKKRIEGVKRRCRAIAETKFTPWPWTVARIHSNGNWLSMIVGDCKPIAEVNCDCLEASNAHLIAAAPELYEALELLLSAQGQIEEKAIRMAQAALAKARGEKA